MLFLGGCVLQEGLVRAAFREPDSPMEEGLTADGTPAADEPGFARHKAEDARTSRPRRRVVSRVSHLPGEFTRPLMVLMAWPRHDRLLLPYFTEILSVVAGEAPSTEVFVPSARVAAGLRHALKHAGVDDRSVRFTTLALDSVWIRDFGPLVVRTTKGGYQAVDLLYDGRRWDDGLPTRLASAWGIPARKVPLVLEGGNLQSDGAGRCLTTEAVLEDNGYSPAKVKRLLREHLGCRQTIILERLEDEPTEHVDMFATVTGPGQVLVGSYAHEEDRVNARRLDITARQLAAAGFQVRRVPMPHHRDGVFRTYTNSLAVGNKVLVPVYADDRRHEARALQVFQQAYPGRVIVPVDSSEIIHRDGALHCVIMTVGA